MEKRLKKITTERQYQRAYMERELINEETRTIPFIMVSDKNSGLRFDWWEDEEFEEVLDVKGAKMDGLNTFFKDHNHSVDSAIGRVTNKRLEDGKLKADVIFSTDEEADKIYRKYVEGILTDVSIGYSINEYKEEKRAGMPNLVTVTDYEIVELSAVWRGFDKGAKVGRSAVDKPTATNQQVKNRMKVIELREGLKSSQN